RTPSGRLLAEARSAPGAGRENGRCATRARPPTAGRDDGHPRARRPRRGPSLRRGTLHLARGGLRGDVGLEHRLGAPAVAGAFLVVLDRLAVNLLPGRDVDGLLDLVVGGAHL